MVELIKDASNSIFTKNPIRRVFSNPVTYIMTMGNTFLIVVLSLIVRTHNHTKIKRFTNSHNEANGYIALSPGDKAM